MYVQKGFIANTRLTSNVPGVVATLGELSSYASTFAREKGLYSDNVIAPNLLLTSFISNEGGVNVPVDNSISSQILDIANFVYTTSSVGLTATVLLENLIVSYVGLAEGFQCGGMVSDENYTVPEWLSWQYTGPGNTGNYIKIWFTDDAFRTQYDEYEVYVVPPVDVIDNFFLSGTQVEAYVKGVTRTEFTERMQVTKQGYPETTMRTLSFDYFDPNNASHVVSTDWGVLIYGIAGDNTDTIKDALMGYILAHSVHARGEWIALLPDIFKRTEFTIIPMWDKLAISGRLITVGIYSPIVQHSFALTRAKEVASTYPSAHIDSHLEVMAHPYKSLTLLVIGSPDNRQSKFEVTDFFPDYIAVTSTSGDFNRMELTTQNWASMIASMLLAAENMQEFTTVPVGMMKMRRDGKLYLAKSFNNVNYLVAARVNFIA